MPPTGEDEEGRQEEVVPVPADLRYGAHTSTCGHVMHSRCWQKFFESVLTKERRRPARYGPFFKSLGKSSRRARSDRPREKTLGNSSVRVSAIIPRPELIKKSAKGIAAL